MSKRELTNSELVACCEKAAAKVAAFLNGVDSHILTLKVSNYDAERMRYNACKTHLGILRDGVQRATQHFYPTYVTRRLEDGTEIRDELETFETMKEKEPKADYRETLLAGVCTYFAMELLKEEMATSELSRINGTSWTFTQCAEICLTEGIWVELARRIHREGKTPADAPEREKQQRLPCNAPVEHICTIV